MSVCVSSWLPPVCERVYLIRVSDHVGFMCLVIISAPCSPDIVQCWIMVSGGLQGVYFVYSFTL